MPVTQAATLRHTVQAAPPDADDRLNRFAPVRHFVHEHWKKNVWAAIGIGCLVISGCQIISHTKAVENKGYAFVVGEDGTVVYGKLRGLNPDSSVYKRFLRTVVRLRLQLTPDGLSDQDGADAVFVGDAKEKLDKDVAKWVKQAQENNLFSIPFITSYRKVAERGQSPVYEVIGYALVTGVSGGIPVREKEPFSMVVQIAPNPKLQRDELVDAPFVVTSYFGLFNKRELEREQARRAKEAQGGK